MFVLTQTTLGKSKTIGGTIKNVFGEDIFKIEKIMCKKSFKVWYLIPSTQDLHRNQIWKKFFQIQKSNFPCPECRNNVRKMFFGLFRENVKKK